MAGVLGAGRCRVERVGTCRAGFRLREQAKTDRATIAEQALKIEFARKVATWFAIQKQ